MTGPETPGGPRLTVVPHPDPARFQLADLPAWIADQITVHPESGCWLWPHVTTDGYGLASPRAGQPRIRAHRLVYQLLAGPLPTGRPLLKNMPGWGCVSRSCCHPAHWTPASYRDNALRPGSIGVIAAAKTHCDNSHEFDNENTYRLPSTGRRDCRKCRRDRKRAFQERQRRQLAQAA